jgi:hypothetical protein
MPNLLPIQAWYQYVSREGSIAGFLEETAMVKSCLVVRAEVPDPGERAAFDHWYATDHLP